MTLFHLSSMAPSSQKLTLGEKFWNISWFFILLICVMSGVGFGILYSVADGSMDPWVDKQLVRFAVGLGVVFVVALTDIRFWMKYAYFLYGVCLLLLAAVPFVGSVALGARRWLDLGLFQLQPSELMKYALVLTLARYFHSLSLQETQRTAYYVFPGLLVLVPVLLIMKQPDLGTAMLLVFGSVFLFFLAGVQIWKFLLVGGIGLCSLPVLWNLLKEYQRERVLTFLNPERDPLGAGYHILQSKITLGSGGVFGKGFLSGTQSHLNFLPEKHTDFIFTVLAEEFGLIGSLGLILLYMIITFYGFMLSLKSQNYFGRMLGFGLTINFFLYAFINIAMVIGLVPVVGVPLPLVSYGGTSLLTLMFGFGLIQCVHTNHSIRIGRKEGADWDG